MSCRLCETGDCPLHQPDDHSAAVHAWMEWDAHPTNPYYVQRLASQVSLLAREQSISTRHLRDEMGTGRREGLSYEKALVRALTIAVSESETAT